MNRKYRNGFGLIEVIISICIVVLLIDMSLLVNYKGIYAYNDQRIHYSAMQIKYNLLQIIKSDSFFLEHPEVYFEDSQSKIKINIVGNQRYINIYFNDYVEVVEEGNARLNALIKCRKFDYGSYASYYYSVEMKERKLGEAYSSIGGITYFYKMENE